MAKKIYSIKTTFNLPDVPEELTVEGRAPEGNPFVPKIDPHYVFRKELLRDVLAWLSMGDDESLYLTGPTGSGKSSIITQVFARLHIPLITVNAHARMEMPDLVGGHIIANGNMRWSDGPLTTAKRLGIPFMIDEIDLIDPANTGGMNAIAEGRPLSIPETNEVVASMEGFRFIVTGNTAGSGDSTGLYSGTLRMNLAFLDRFWMVKVEYPETKQEEEILEKAASMLPEPIRKCMIDFANEVRKLFIGGEIEVTMSTRTIIRWAKLAAFFKPLSGQGINPIIHALDRALGYKAESDSQQALHEIAQRIFA